MPDLGLKPHVRRSEGVVGGDLDIYIVCAALVGCVWGARKRTAEMCEVIVVACGFDNDL